MTATSLTVISGSVFGSVSLIRGTNSVRIEAGVYQNRENGSSVVGAVIRFRVVLLRHAILFLLLYCSQAWSWVIHKSTSLEYKPSSEPHHISAE